MLFRLSFITSSCAVLEKGLKRARLIVIDYYLTGHRTRKKATRLPQYVSQISQTGPLECLVLSSVCWWIKLDMGQGLWSGLLVSISCVLTV